MKTWGPARFATALIFSLGLAGAPLALGPTSAQAIMRVAPPPPDLSNVVHMLKIEGDRAGGQVNFIGEPRHHMTFGSINTWWRLKTFIDTRTMAVSHHLLLDFWYAGKGPRGFDAAIDDEGQTLAVTKMGAGRDVDNFSERSWAPISDGFLRRHMLTGFSVTVDSEWGDARTITVTPAQVQSQIVTEEAVVRPGYPGMKPPVADAAEGAGKPAAAGVR
jgi:hypothetical protein